MSLCVGTESGNPGNGHLLEWLSELMTSCGGKRCNKMVPKPSGFLSLLEFTSTTRRALFWDRKRFDVKGV